jgi:ubiquinone/menaquinone biosynthesis C-methylase UbiE
MDVKNSKHYWERLAQEEETIGGKSGRWIDDEKYLKEALFLAKRLSLDDSHAFLSVGCGSGAYLRYLSGNTKINVGIDYAENAIYWAKRVVSNSYFCVAEANRLPFKDNFFDRIICYSVFLCFPNLDYAYQVIDELLRVCKPAGIILLGDLPDKKSYRKFISWKKEVLLFLRLLLGIEKRSAYGHHRNWLWFDLDRLHNFITSKGHLARILNQPPYFCFAHNRKDILVLK